MTPSRCTWCGELVGRRVTPPTRCDRCGWRGGLEADNGIGDGPVGLLIMGLADARYGATGFEGQWLSEFDPERQGKAPANSLPITAHVATTEDPDQAIRFADVAAARRLWMRWDKTTRPDGRPSRPLTAFTIEVSRLPA